MALSTSGAIKAFLEGPTAMGGAQIGVAVYADLAPDPKTAKPYVLISEALPITPDVLEDGAASTVHEHVTIDIWMSLKTKTNEVPESRTLPTTVVRALQGSRLLTSGSGAPPTIVYGILIHSAGPRVVEADANVVHYPIWAEVLRAL